MRQSENSRWRLRRSQSLIFVVAGLLLISLACNTPGLMPVSNQEKPEGFVVTSVAQTLAVIEAIQLPEGTDSGIEGTQIPAETALSTPTPTDLSSTPSLVKVFMSENTNCRTGQGTSFERLMILLKGEEAEVVGVDTTGDYWYIRRPDQPSDFCWMWAKYTTPTGPYQSLPVYTQIPTATPGFEFEVTYHSNIGFCGGFYVLQYRINNTGSFTLESWRTTSTDHTGGSDPLPNIQNKFYDKTGCAPVGEKLKLTPGDAYFVSAMFTNDPVGHDITITVQVCTEDGLGGECTSKTYRHTP